MIKKGKYFNCEVCGSESYVPQYRFSTAVVCSVSCKRKLKFHRMLRNKGKEIVSLYKSGKSIRQVAYITNINNRTVLKILDYYGISTRKGSEAIKQQWKNGRTPNSNIRKNHRIVRSRGKCERCNSTKNLEIDHIDGKGSNIPHHLRNESLINLRLLCRHCHIILETERRLRSSSL